MTEQRTLVVSQNFPPESLGGAHRWQKLAEEFPEDHDCRVLCPPPAFPYGEFDRSWKPIEREKIEGIPVTRLWTFQPKRDATSDGSNLGRILNFVLFSLFASLYVLIHHRKYDNVITVSAPHTTFLPGIVGDVLGVRWYPDIFDLWLDNAVDIGYAEEGSISHRVIAFFERQAICSSEHVFVITETMARHYSEKYGVDREQFTLVPFGVDGETFTSSTTEKESSKVVYTGNMGEAHALRPFIESMKHLKGTARLELIGTGKRRPELEEFVEQRGLDDVVTFKGVVPREEISDILSSAAVCLVPLKQRHRLDYARPNKLLEGMAVGTPYVASSLTEIDRITDESEAGFAVENEPREVASAIERIVTNHERSEQMGRNGVEFIEREHRWSLLAARMADVLEANET